MTEKSYEEQKFNQDRAFKANNPTLDRRLLEIENVIHTNEDCIQEVISYLQDIDEKLLKIWSGIENNTSGMDELESRIVDLEARVF